MLTYHFHYFRFNYGLDNSQKDIRVPWRIDEVNCVDAQHKAFLEHIIRLVYREIYFRPL
jgi:hypothetical protein